MSRADVGIVTQVGVETTHGTNVTAAKKFLDLMMYFDPNLLTKFYRASGRKNLTTGVKHREWSVGRYETDVVSFNSIVYIFSMLWGHGTVAQIGVTGAYTWPFSPSSSAGDAFYSLTVQMGDAEAAQEVTFGTALNLNITFNQDGISMNGDMIGRTIDNSVSLDTVADEIDEAPISFADLTFYTDALYANVGTTVWAKVLEASLSLPRIREPKFVLNAAIQSFDDLVEVPVEDSTLTIVAEYDAQTRAFMDAQRADSLPVRYIQIKAVGDNIGTSADFTFKMNFAVKLESCTPRRNVQGVYAYEFKYRILHSEAMGRALEATVINKLSAL